MTTSDNNTLPDWPYPFWIAHRGAGKLAPENTLAAFRLGAQYGWRMFECDAKLSADGVLFLMHDTTLQRTTSGRGIGGEHTWGQLSQLDAGGWHSRHYAGEPLVTLENAGRFCRHNKLQLNIEIKPTPGQEDATGTAVARQVAQQWQGAAVPPLLSSFSVPALQAAQRAAPQLPRALLLHQLPSDWLQRARALRCHAVVCQYQLWTEARVQQAHAAGLRALSYTVNDEAPAQRLRRWRTDGIISDRIDLFAPASA